MLKMKNKKGTNELGMSTIIIIVLALSMLILGLVLIKNIFEKPEFNITKVECKNVTFSSFPIAYDVEITTTKNNSNIYYWLGFEKVKDKYNDPLLLASKVNKFREVNDTHVYYRMDLTIEESWEDELCEPVEVDEIKTWNGKSWDCTDTGECLDAVMIAIIIGELKEEKIRP